MRRTGLILARRFGDLRAPQWASWLGRHEPAVLVALMLSLLAFWLFIALGAEVLEGDSHAFDRRIILAMRNPADLNDPIGPKWFEDMMRDFTALGSVAILMTVTFAAAGYLALERKYRAVVLMIGAVCIGLAISHFMKLGYDRPRPDLLSHDTQFSTTSFPSGHSMGAAVAYLTLAVLLSRVSSRQYVKAYFLLLGLLLASVVGVSRVYLGVHWPTDVLGGWAAGAGWALLCWSVARILQRRGAVETAIPVSDEAYRPPRPPHES